MTNETRDECTEKEELYAQLRASGRSKTDSAKKAYPDSKNPRQMGYQAELRTVVKERIRELKEERAEAAELDVNEQVRRYTELYFMALEGNKLETAAKMLERIDSIGGFDAPSKNISLKGNIDDAANVLRGDDLKKDIERFSGVLGKHHEKPSKEDMH